MSEPLPEHEYWKQRCVVQKDELTLLRTELDEANELKSVFHNSYAKEVIRAVKAESRVIKLEGCLENVIKNLTGAEDVPHMEDGVCEYIRDIMVDDSVRSRNTAIMLKEQAKAERYREALVMVKNYFWEPVPDCGETWSEGEVQNFVEQALTGEQAEQYKGDIK